MTDKQIRALLDTASSLANAAYTVTDQKTRERLLRIGHDLTAAFKQELTAYHISKMCYTPTQNKPK